MPLKQPTEDEFYEMVNGFIELANKHSNKKMAITAISDAILYAAARYNAFMVASADGTEDLSAEEDAAVKDFMNQYKLWLHEHFAFYKSNPVKAEGKPKPPTTFSP